MLPDGICIVMPSTLQGMPYTMCQEPRTPRAGPSKVMLTTRHKQVKTTAVQEVLKSSSRIMGTDRRCALTC